MSKWNDDEPRLDERRVIAPDVPKHRARKPTRRWCRGKVGIEHVLDVRLSRYAQYRSVRGDDNQACHRSYWSPRRWWCSHERYCVNCGKILNHTLGNDCPDFTTQITRHRPS